MCDRKDEEDANRLVSSRCIDVYKDLNTCLKQKNRDWRKCQPELMVLKECYSEQSDSSQVSKGHL